MALLELPDPITGLVSQHSTAKNLAIWVHCGVYTVSAFLVTGGTTAQAWYFQVHSIPTATFLGILNGCIAAGGALTAVWRLNSPTWLKVPPPSSA